MRLFCFILLLVSLHFVQQAEAVARQKTLWRENNLTIRIDFQSARAVIDLLNRTRVSDAELEQAAVLPGNRQLIKKVFDDNPARGREVFIKTLRQTIDNQKFADDPFDWQTVKRNLPEINLLIGHIERSDGQMLAEIKRIVEPYTPEDLRINVSAVFLVGGGSLGFTLDGDPNFYVGLQKIGGDYEGLKYLLAHELYHSIQAAGRRRQLSNAAATKLPDNIVNCRMLVDNVYREGTATLVGNPLEAQNLKLFGESQQAEYRKNLARSRQNFALFEALLFQAAGDPATDAFQLYAIGFSTSFDETLYYVGFRMARDLAKYKGKAVIAKLVDKNPLELFKQYIELYRQNDDPSLIRFNKSTERILLSLPD